MERGQPAAERGLSVACRNALLDPLEHQELMGVRHRQDSRNADIRSLSDPDETGRLGGEMIRWSRRMGLGEHPAPIIEIQPKRDRHITAVHTRRTHDTCAELVRDLSESGLHQSRIRRLSHLASLPHPHDLPALHGSRRRPPPTESRSLSDEDGDDVFSEFLGHPRQPRRGSAR